MKKRIDIIGAGLAGSEAALQLARHGFSVRLFEMRPFKDTVVHKTSNCAELVCSNSLKSLNPESAAGMLKRELSKMGSVVLGCAYKAQVPAGGALAVDREAFSSLVTQTIRDEKNIEFVIAEVVALDTDGALWVVDDAHKEAYRFDDPADAVLISSGPLTSDELAHSLGEITGTEQLAFYDAAAPIVLADSLDRNRVFSQSRYANEGEGDYLNAPFSKEEYEHFIEELIGAECVIKKNFETKDLFQACQPVEEIARRGFDAPRYGSLKPVGLSDPHTQKRPWAVVQLRAEDKHKQSYNLVGFQTNLTFSEQKRVFRMIPGLENAEFARFGVMHRNTFINAPQLLDSSLRLKHSSKVAVPVFIAGQLGGTEGYCEAIASGLVSSVGIASCLLGYQFESLPVETAFGALLAYATAEETLEYQPMHVNFGIMPPFEKRIKNKKERYAAYAARGEKALDAYLERNKTLF